MSLTPSTGVISLSTLRANLDDQTAVMLTNMRAGAKDFTRFLRLDSLASGADVSLRSTAWTQPDDQELRILMARVTNTAVRVIGIALEVENGDTVFLVDNSVVVPLSTSNGTTDTRTDYRTTTGTRLRLARGVRYRLSFTNTSGFTIGGPLQVGVQLRSLRRMA